MIMKKTNSERLYYLDFLRIISAFAVVFLHVCAQNWFNVSYNSYKWNILNIYDSLVRWCVPVFVMISGVLFLQKDKTIKELYSKNIFHIFLVLILWSFIYSVVELFQNNLTIKDSVILFIKGTGHLWYLKMILGLYILIPIIKRVVQDKKLTKYVLSVIFIFSMFLPQLIYVIGVKYETLLKIFNDIMKYNIFTYSLGFIFYFILGYHINNTVISDRNKKVIYVLGLAGFLFTAISTYLISKYTKTNNSMFYDFCSINVALESIAIFVFAKDINYKFSIKSEKFKRIITSLSKYSFGCYLIHMLVIKELSYFGLNTLSFNPIISVIFISFIVIIISFGISALINNIPFLKKYVV